jgi:hypothetical protein
MQDLDARQLAAVTGGQDSDCPGLARAIANIKAAQSSPGGLSPQKRISLGTQLARYKDEQLKQRCPAS